MEKYHGPLCHCSKCSERKIVEETGATKITLLRLLPQALWGQVPLIMQYTIDWFEHPSCMIWFRNDQRVLLGMISRSFFSNGVELYGTDETTEEDPTCLVKPS
jgi:hypothetical protein